MSNKYFRKTPIALVQGLLAAVVLMTTSLGLAFAAPKVEILNAEYAGSGCPGGTASISFSPNGQKLTIRFNQFIARGNKPNESRKSCNLTIPIRVSKGYQVSLYDASYRGNVAPRTTGKLRAEYFFAGQPGSIFSRTFTGKREYNVRDSLRNRTNVWSRCGDSVNMRVNSSMIAEGQGTATVEQMVADIGVRRCK
ncbi:DUF4360 domain-containing protein [Calothrix sp. UHCC 0171]|uniref:DUF4360 domain-containing protein n=1 Tax=Calothrix sp. UHCC 0171 TaxID=3110245 RepID=UPI002B209B7E|nr:DUF4360 domain-containing protein [Calothrix sp. UHCC 0171]MEA5572363.1 DUF4360 domain-containing protein [Calothrix sp. UHCC 0171]